MSLAKHSVVAATCFAAALAVGPGTAAAQVVDCGRNCMPCGDNKHEGINHAVSAPHNMDCIGPVETGTCTACSAPSVSRKAVDAMIIARVVQAATVRELRAVVAAYGDRLLLNASRNVVVVKGNGCDPDALSTVVYLAPSKARVFARLNVASLEEFVPAARTTRTGA